MTHGLDDPGTGVRRQRSMSRRRGREPVLKVSNTIAACNYLSKNTATQSGNKKSFINTRQSSRAAAGPARKSWFSRKAKNVVNHTPVPPSIVLAKTLTMLRKIARFILGKMKGQDGGTALVQ